MEFVLIGSVDIADIPVTIAFGLVGTDEGAAFVVQHEAAFKIEFPLVGLR